MTTSVSPPEQARLAAGLGLKPVPIHGKWVRQGDSPSVIYDPSDWLQGETLALRAGRQDDGLFLVRLDLDRHEEDQDPLARLNDIRTAAGDSVYRKLVILKSTTRTGRDVVFKTPLPLRTMGIIGLDGVPAGEIKCEGGNSRVNIPTDPRQWIQGSIESIASDATLSESETNAVLAAFVLPEQKKPSAPASRPRSGNTSARSLAWVKANIDPIDYLISKGATLARARGNNATLHCFCSFHKHGDRTPSLSVTTNRDGYLVVFGKSDTCIFKANYGLDVVNLIGICEGLNEREIIDRYCPAHIPPNAPSAPAVQPQSTPVTAEPSKDALRKRDERQRQRDERKEVIRAAIESTPGISKRARELALSLLAEDSLQSRTTNRQLAARLGWSRPTVIRAFRDLEAAKLGKRSGGVSHLASADGQWIAAAWNWFNDNLADTPKDVHAALSDTPIDSTNSEPVGACEEEISPAAAAITPAITNTLRYTRADIKHMLRTYFDGIETGKRASFKQASAYVEDNTLGAVAAELVQEIYNRLMEQRKWDLATRDIPTMDWKVLKREGARARGMAAKLIKQGDNAAWFSALANEFDREIQRRVSAGQAPEHYRTRRKSKALAEPTPIELALSVGDADPLDISSSQATPEPTPELVQPEYRAVASNYFAFKQARSAGLV